MTSVNKSKVEDLALFGGNMLFARARSTSNLYQPNFDRFLAYSKIFFEAGQYTNNGPLVMKLERRLAEFHKTRYCVCFCSGFWALVLAIRCLALAGRVEVVMPSLTYRRLADVVAWAGLIPRFCDVDPSTLAISPKTVEPHLGLNTALIIAVHPIVNCCDAVQLEQLGLDYGIPILFDGVESVYETIASRKVGSFGNGECFSLHASKLINGFEGGYLTTNDEALFRRLALMRGFGFANQDYVVELGTNAKLNEIHAAMALACLDELEDQIVRNRERYRCYQRNLKDISGIRLLSFDESEQCSFKNIVVELLRDWPLSRSVTLDLMNAEGVLARAYYSPPLHMKKATYSVITGSLPFSELLSENFVLMPCGEHVDIDDIHEIVGLLVFIKDNSAAIRQQVAA